MSYIAKYVVTAAALAVLASCSSRNTAGVGEVAYRQALNQAFDELKVFSAEGRELASVGSTVEAVGADLSKLRGSIEVVVFPKLSNMAEKSRAAIKSEFGRPSVFTFNVVRNLKCSQLVRENTSKWNHRENFKSAAASNLDCAILRINQSEPRPLAANARQGDVKETHIYIDSQYAVYGYDFEILRNRRDSEVVRVKTDALLSSGSSGLGAVPLDLPPAQAAQAVIKGDQVVKASTDAFVNRKLAEMGIALTCSRGNRIAYKDVYGQRNNVQWCRGDVWPTVVENERFVAVLKRGK